MTYRERTKAVCASILLILKNATIIIPVVEGILYTIFDLIKPEKKETNDGRSSERGVSGSRGTKDVDSKVIEPEEIQI